MVKLNKIYTRSGDEGTTALGAGGRVPKTDPRVVAYGTVDEANSSIGVAAAEAVRAGTGDGAVIAAALAGVQQDLFDVGADLCVPVSDEKPEFPPLRVTPEQTARLEGLIDEHNEGLGELRSFVLPGGSPLAAALHLARTIVRRAERETVTLAVAQPESTNPETIRYLNRLSDLLFVLSRVANDRGEADVLWVPGANRES
ncbi:MAG: cob(I)yrinic acid a,c-diamide adenosyltransferase [Planctomycetota bacterium]